MGSLVREYLVTGSFIAIVVGVVGWRRGRGHWHGSKWVGFATLGVLVVAWPAILSRMAGEALNRDRLILRYGVCSLGGCPNPRRAFSIYCSPLCQLRDARRKGRR